MDILVSESALCSSIGLSTKEASSTHAYPPLHVRPWPLYRPSNHLHHLRHAHRHTVEPSPHQYSPFRKSFLPLHYSDSPSPQIRYLTQYSIFLSYPSSQPPPQLFPTSSLSTLTTLTLTLSFSSSVGTNPKARSRWSDA
jgi:hypothetical protein